MHRGSFVQLTPVLIILTSLSFLGAFASGVPAAPNLMAPWSALAFLITGSTLLGASSARGEHLGLHRIGAIVVFAIGAIVVFAIGAIVSVEHLAHAGLTAFDGLLFPTLLPLHTAHPGRPAPIAGFRYCVLGVMLFLTPARGKRLVLVREWTAISIITVCYFGFVAVMSGWGTASPASISPYAAILGILAAGHVLATGPNGRLVPLLRDSGPGGLIARSLMPVPVILPVITMTVRHLVTGVRIDDSRRPDGIIFASINIIAALAVVWIGASKVLSIDLLRRRAEDDLRGSFNDLDHRVQLRTHELLAANEHLAVEVANRKRAQSELQKTNAMLASLFEACPLAITAFSLDGCVRKSNAAAEAMRLGDSLECRALAERAGRGETVAATALVREVDGKTLHLHVWASPTLTQDARLDGVVMMAADVSERKALEANIQQNQRLESLGVLAGGIAHDFNNLLTGVIGNASVLQDHFQSESREARAATDLLEAGHVMAKLTSQMLAYSGRGRFQIEPLDLSAEVRQITNLVQASIPKSVRVRLVLDGNLPKIAGDSSQIQQVIMNLVINGAEALGPGQGAVEVRTLARRAEESELAGGVARPPAPVGDYVVLEVRDSGAGMDEETKSRIFDPFFTTKFAGRGLGLSAVLGIVRAHHGSVIVESSPGSGTTFRVLFPCAAACTPTAPREWATNHQGSGTVLIVDDEEFVLRMARLILDQAGYKVLSACNGREALAVYEAHAACIDAVLLDMTMPVMDGEEMMEHLAARWPEATVVATSGYDRQEAESRFGRRMTGFLQKPYTATQLTAKIAAAIGSRRGASSLPADFPG